MVKYQTRCQNCGALNEQASGECRLCGKAQLLKLDRIPDILLRYPQLRQTEAGYEGPASRTHR